MWPQSNKEISRSSYGFPKTTFTFLAILLFISNMTIVYTADNLENISCHYSLGTDALPLLDDNFDPPTSSIYFHETSCRGNLNSRQACAVESAARAHPHWQVFLFFAGPVTEDHFNNGSLRVLKRFRNVKVMRLEIVNYAKGTLLEGMVRRGALKRSRWQISHTSDVLRYLSLYKWGGVYLDLDMVVVKDLSGLAKNWAARQSDSVVAAGALSFSTDRLGRVIASAALWVLKSNYNGDEWADNGPGVITSILKKICRTKYLPSMSAELCKGFEVYSPELFYPVSWYNASDYFSPGELNVGDPYTHHVWNSKTSDYKVEKDSAYARLAQQYCPSVFNIYGDRFGL